MIIQPSETVLYETLKALGIEGESEKFEIIIGSTPDAEGNSEVYKKTNDILSSRIDQRPLSESIHITGELLAISDPHHRMVCRKLWRKHSTKFETVAWLPKEFRYNGTKFLLRLIDNWTNKTWQHHLDAMYLIANGETDIYAQDEMEDIHYSVFDDDLILLQSKHDPKEHRKNVWLLRSESLNEKLKPKLINSKNKSELVNPMICRSVVDTLSSTFALDVLYTLEEKQSLSESLFLDKFKSTPYFNQFAIENLRAIGFIETNKEYSITANGLGYLKLLN